MDSLHVNCGTSSNFTGGKRRSCRELRRAYSDRPGRKETGSRQPMQPRSSRFSCLAGLTAWQCTTPPRCFSQVTKSGARNAGSTVDGQGGEGWLCRCARSTRKQKWHRSEAAETNGPAEGSEGQALGHGRCAAGWACCSTSGFAEPERALWSLEAEGGTASTCDSTTGSRWSLLPLGHGGCGMCAGPLRASAGSRVGSRGTPPLLTIGADSVPPPRQQRTGSTRATGRSTGT
mmetsp:Transcript_23973/g.71335  ORF Transcript_23973/g.71335 Transcript_23973/m.71335 type:complete len:232 (-) Transcript_23973:108-803(-)